MSSQAQVAQVDRAPARFLGGYWFKSCRELRLFSLSHAPDMLVISQLFIFTGAYSQTRPSVPVANKLMNSLMEK